MTSKRHPTPVSREELLSAIYNYIQGYIAEHRDLPTYKEIALACGIPKNNGVIKGYLDELRALDKGPFDSRVPLATEQLKPDDLLQLVTELAKSLSDKQIHALVGVALKRAKRT